MRSTRWATTSAATRRPPCSRCWTPSQNVAFRDHYIELPFDLADVLFLTTANDLSTVPRPLLDRMEVIELSSYTEEEKRQIALHHLLPKQMKKHGLQKSQLGLSEKMLGKVISGYTREAGVRRLEQLLAKLCRKAAKHVADGGQAPDRDGKEHREPARHGTV